VKILLPKNTGKNWRKLVKQLALVKPMQPFEQLSQKFVQEIAKAITQRSKLLSLELKQTADWISPRHLRQIRQSYESKRQNRIWLPRGVVLHFTPANVDSLFIYSWFVSLLLGNVNIIRISRSRNRQIRLILDVLNSVLGQKRFKPIRQRNLIVSYRHEQEITEELSRNCDVRVIWGGDETIKQIRAIPLPPRSTELVFADRFSMAALKADAVLHASEQEIARLAKNIYYDTFFFSQKGCFSPKLLFWIGKKQKINSAKIRFWQAVKRLASGEKIDWQKGIGVARMTTGYRYAAEGIADKLSTAGTEFPYRVHLKEFKKNWRQIHSGGGIFLEAEKATLIDILELLISKDQTLSVYGFSRIELERFASRLSGYGLDRIVPIGQALNFQVVWDGYDLFTDFTREVTVA
jgi:hypothetical protein